MGCPHWEYIVVHHSATKDYTLADIEGIRRFHTSYRHYGDIISEEEYERLKSQGKRGLSIPWADIGYHFLVEHFKDPNQWWIIHGRPLYLQGAHCVGMNRKALGVCLVGNYDDVAPSNGGYNKTAQICAELAESFQIPTGNIRPHHEYASYKTCPGKLFDMDHLRELVDNQRMRYRSCWRY